MKPKVVFYWCASCGGCEETVLDLDEEVLAVVDAVDIVFWPVALDFKTRDVESMPDRSILASFINGGIRNSEQKEMAEMLRAKSQLVIAFGACAQSGGVPGLANLSSTKAIMEEAYPGGTAPSRNWRENGYALSLPEFFDALVPLEKVIDVDYTVPGCPPTPNLIRSALETLLGGDLPPKGTVLAPDHALCEQCPRKDTRPEKTLVKVFKRVHQAVADEQTCLLAQGFACLGPGTRAGCEAMCIRGNMPCTGCFGPTSRVREFGAKALSAIASVIDSNEEQEIARVLDAGVPDPAGTFYRYSLPGSLLGRRRTE